MKIVGTTILAIGIFAFSTSTYAQGQHIVGKGYFGCTSKDYFDKVIGYIVDKDQVAFKKALLAGLMTGQCTLFKNGEAVYLTDTSVFSGLAQVRPKGDTTAYWTNIEAVK